ncbi:hypothetical protein [Mucilaginibacter sp.]|uniref:hypothetical protein n=1 Tax=Mucilaginibacter sp. TaxID=1882438 RepID=UPI0025F9B8C8|nr:hypothetical protein [Mucilaginibacter sp.]
MENSFATPPSPVLRCDGCFTAISDVDVYCANCGYPLKGTPDEQKRFIYRQNKSDFDLVAFTKRVKNAGETLYYLAGYFIFAGLVNTWHFWGVDNMLAIVIPNLILAMLFVALAGYSAKKPLACFISGLALYVVVEILIIVNNPGSIGLVSLIIIGVIIGYLIKGIKSAVDIEKIKRQHNIV